MQSLICEALSCMYNSGQKCSANVIHVNGTLRETFCDTFTRDGTFVEEQKFRMPDFPGPSDAEFSEFVDSPRISCTVTRCAYNKAFHCKAGNVKINDPHDSNNCRCSTYRPK